MRVHVFVTSFIFAPRSCEKPKCIFNFWRKVIIFSHKCILARVKEMTLGYITYYSTHYLFLIYFLHVPQILNSCGVNFGNVLHRPRP